MPSRSLNFGADIICKMQWKNRSYYIVTASDKSAGGIPINFVVSRWVLSKAFGRDKVKRFDALDDFVNFSIPKHYFQTIYNACYKAALRMPTRTKANDGYIELIEEDFHESEGTSCSQCEGAVGKGKGIKKS